MAISVSVPLPAVMGTFHGILPLYISASRICAVSPPWLQVEQLIKVIHAFATDRAGIYTHLEY